jgi:Rps23 Pro-64 3,4-dihydroxylase Tpa1-like proline 4-hydroxylase
MSNGNITYFDNKVISEREAFRNIYQSKKPFKYLIIDGVLKEEAAHKIHDQYPKVTDGRWEGTTYLDQKNKFQKTIFEKNSLLQSVFDELNSEAFLEWLSYITEIKEPLISDPELSGGGLHQSTNGAFLNVHVDFNIHPKNKFHRRLNVLIYMNKDWKDEYEGHLELWEISQNYKNLLEKISPKFNRLVLFETNEVSFHGHPKPLKTPPDVSRKSLATYYYTKTRPDSEIADEHNTIYINTEGVKGSIGRFKSGVKAALERVNKR